MAMIYRTDPPEAPTTVLAEVSPAVTEAQPALSGAPAGPAPTTSINLPVMPLPSVGTTDASADKPRAITVFLCFVGLIGIWIAALLVFPDDDYDPARATTVAQGLTIFSVFFVAAQGLERLLEPLAMYFVPAAEARLKEAEKNVEDTKAAAVAEQHQSLTTGDGTLLLQKTDELKGALDHAASMTAAATQWRLDRKVIFWAIASSVAVVASAGMKLYLLKTVGISSAPRSMEVLATGLIIGAGTKPLHDLVTLISAKADSARTDSKAS